MQPRPTIRWAEPADVPLMLEMIRTLAAYEKLLHEVKATEADLLRDGFGPNRRFECRLAFVGDRAVGYMFFFPIYSTFEGRQGLYLEDIYVAEEMRNKGVGRALLRDLAAITVERGGTRLELRPLTWNPARRLYEAVGFVELGEWVSYRLTGDALAALAARDG
jgi:ribosomal protein S18 acetylase RimI-like enzyme